VKNVRQKKLKLSDDWSTTDGSLTTTPQKVLGDIGFIWSVRAYKADQLLAAVEAYKDIKGAPSSIFFSFVCPSEAPWPKQLWGYPLGKVLGNVRHHDTYPELRNKLRKLGVDYDYRIDIRGGELLVVALRRYKELYGDFHVSKHFVIPGTPPNNSTSNRSIQDDVRAGDDADAGVAPTASVVDDEILQTETSRLSSSDDDDHKVLDISRDDNSTDDDRCESPLRTETKTGSKEKKGKKGGRGTTTESAAAEAEAVTAEEASSWPEAVRGMKLGEKVRNVRYHQSYPEILPVLQEMGVVAHWEETRRNQQVAHSDAALTDNAANGGH
jgi:hypothetical protein